MLGAVSLSIYLSVFLSFSLIYHIYLQYLSVSLSVGLCLCVSEEAAHIPAGQQRPTSNQLFEFGPYRIPTMWTSMVVVAVSWHV